MFSYYGSKSRIVHLYPAPLHEKIIEPFAGSARYSLKYYDHDVTLVDKYEVIVRVWLWLQKCSVQDILGLPELKKGLDLRDLNISEDERLFLGLCCGIAATVPRNKVSPFAAEQNSRKNRWKRIADQLHKIRHWTIIHGDYQDIKNENATWFIDPPYQYGGSAYKENKVDFKSLGEWCQTRNGQVMVCENMRSDWMPFQPLSEMRGANQKFQTEAIWTNTPRPIIQQQSLF